MLFLTNDNDIDVWPHIRTSLNSVYIYVLTSYCFIESLSEMELIKKKKHWILILKSNQIKSF